MAEVVDVLVVSSSALPRHRSAGVREAVLQPDGGVLGSRVARPSRRHCARGAQRIEGWGIRFRVGLGRRPLLLSCKRKPH